MMATSPMNHTPIRINGLLRGKTAICSTLVLALSILVLPSPLLPQAAALQQQCSATEADFTSDPALQTMKFDIGFGPQEFLAYVEPDVSLFYQEKAGSRKKQVPAHNGWAAKFVNMSTQRVKLFWYVSCSPNNGVLHSS